jgi:predicted ribosome quality control (RQC) complex YloA/Tae2 family protein
MPFDAIAMTAVTDEIAGLAGSRIQKIIQPGTHSIALGLYGGGRQRWLLLSADPRFGRVQLTDGPLAKAFPAPSAFVMLLRKYLEGAHLSGVRQLPWERVFEAGGEGRDLTLVAEIMGKHSNLIARGPDGVVLGALKIVPPRESRVRPILPGRPYQPPPSRDRDTAIFPIGERLDPAVETDAFRELWSEAGDATVADALLGLLPGCSPFLARQVAVRAGISPSAPAASVPAGDIAPAAAESYDLWHRHAWQPTVFADARHRMDFAPYRPMDVEDVREVATTSEAIDLAIAGEETRDVLSTRRQAILGEVNRRLGAARRRVASLETGLQAAGEADEAMRRGQMILAYQHAIGPQDDRLAIPELDMTIPLDPRLSAIENAERAFKRYRKLRDARARIPELLEEARREVAEAEDLGAFVQLAGSEGDLRDLERELHPQQPSRTGRKTAKRGPLRMTSEGHLAIVGRSARENEELTFKLSSRDDLWLHARQRTGAHVVLRGGQSVGDRTLEKAAALAAYYSEGRDDTYVEVDVAPVRDVRKIPGGPPGRVTYRNFRTVRVRPSADGWEKSAS